MDNLTANQYEYVTPGQHYRRAAPWRRYCACGELMTDDHLRADPELTAWERIEEAANGTVREIPTAPSMTESAMALAARIGTRDAIGYQGSAAAHAENVAYAWWQD